MVGAAISFGSSVRSRLLDASDAPFRQSRSPSSMISCDLLVLGSGVAGLTFALRAAEHAEVVVLTKRAREDSNTLWAQGGIAAVMDPDDSAAAHVEDTLVAGAGLCHRVVVEICAGVYALDEKSGKVETFLARATVLATGGAGKVYLYTTNPDVATGDGVAMAYRAGAEIGNLEFYQFHPTCLYHPRAKNFLITEALRGDGAILRLVDATALRENHDPRNDLAPHHIVARPIDCEMKRTGSDHVLLDITHEPKD